MIYSIEEKLKEEFTPEYLKGIRDSMGDWHTYEFDTRSYSNSIEGRLTRSYTLPVSGGGSGTKQTEEIAIFSLAELSGNGSVVVSHGVYVREPFRNKGINTMLNLVRARAAKAAGATMLLATVRNDNEAEKRVLVKCGWLPGAQTSDVQVWTKAL